MDTRQRIIEKTDELFHMYGIRSVTMDDIARALGISKKTIYQFFKDKDEIVTTVSRYHMEHEREEIEGIYKNSANALEELFNISVCLRKNVADINPSIIYDLQKYHAKGWQIFLDYKEKVFKQTIKLSIERGISEGYYRSEIDPEILATLRMEEIQLAFDQSVFPRNKFDFRKVQTQIFDHFIFGILTPKGQKIYQETILTETKTQKTYEQ